MLAGSEVQIPSQEKSSIKIQLTYNNPTSSLIVNQIYMGRTYIYQTEEQIEVTNIIFPEGAPESLLVNVIYCKSQE